MRRRGRKPKKPGRFRRFVGRFVVNSVVASVKNDGFPSWVKDHEKHMNIAEPVAPLEPLEPTQEKHIMSGWKTVAFSAAVVALGVLESASVTDIIAQNPGPVAIGIGIATFILRLVTKTPAFKGD